MIIKKIKKGITLVCLMCAITTQTAPMLIQAKVPEQAQPFMTYITSYSADLTISGNGIANVTAYVVSKSNASNAYVKATLQKKSGNSWVDVKSWHSTGNSGYTGVTETYSVSKGTYRIAASFKVDSETKNVTSASRTY